jgi:hypothetical protein
LNAGERQEGRSTLAVNHGVATGSYGDATSQFHEGRFGRLLRQLDKLEPAEADLIELADTVIEKAFRCGTY